MRSMSPWFVYVLKNTEHPPRYYTGHTSDVVRRLAEHNTGSCIHPSLACIRERATDGRPSFAHTHAKGARRARREFRRTKPGAYTKTSGSVSSVALAFDVRASSIFKRTKTFGTQSIGIAI